MDRNISAVFYRGEKNNKHVRLQYMRYDTDAKETFSNRFRDSSGKTPVARGQRANSIEIETCSRSTNRGRV